MECSIFANPETGNLYVHHYFQDGIQHQINKVEHEDGDSLDPKLLFINRTESNIQFFNQSFHFEMKYIDTISLQMFHKKYSKHDPLKD